jgi:adenine phosphoribosyltransferase
MNIKDTIRSIPGWPIEEVIFRDLTTLMQNPAAYKETCDIFYRRYQEMPIDKVVGIDARGFVFGGVLAYHLNVGFIPVRKKGKLPYDTIEESYSLEYGESVVEMHADAIEPGEKVVIIDDLIATGGTIGAAVNLVKKLGGDILGDTRRHQVSGPEKGLHSS